MQVHGFPVEAFFFSKNIFSPTFFGLLTQKFQTLRAINKVTTQMQEERNFRNSKQAEKNHIFVPKSGK